MNYQRLTDFFHFAIRNSPDWKDGVKGIWGGMLATIQADLLRALVNRDLPALETILNTPQVLYGLEHWERFTWESERGLEALNKLGRRIGLVAVQNPEQASPRQTWLIRDIPGLKTKVEESCGELSIPECFGRAVAQGADAPYMLLHHLAQCLTLKMLLPRFPERILEIGAGVGLFGFSAHRFGCRAYTIIDLPTTAVIAAYFLAFVFGENAVWLHGEPERDDVYARVYSSICMAEVNQHYDLVFNSNSLPEMPTVDQDKYLRSICSWLSIGGMFYSVNHESDLAEQRSVPFAIVPFQELQLMYRAPFMLRDGYVEEIYRKV